MSTDHELRADSRGEDRHNFHLVFNFNYESPLCRSHLTILHFSHITDYTVEADAEFAIFARK